MLKTILVYATCFCFLTQVSAQEKSKFMLGIEVGPILFSDSENLSFLLNIEPKINSSENTVIGLRVAATINSQAIENDDPSNYGIHEEADNGAISFIPTFDYRFNEGDFRPYLGVGVGYYLLASYVEVTEYGPGNPSDKLIKVGTDNKVGFLFRGGFDLRRMRFGMEYNLIPKADLIIPNGPTIGTIDNSYFGLVFGYTIGRHY